MFAKYYVLLKGFSLQWEFPSINKKKQYFLETENDKIDPITSLNYQMTMIEFLTSEKKFPIDNRNKKKNHSNHFFVGFIIA